MRARTEEAQVRTALELGNRSLRIAFPSTFDETDTLEIDTEG
jgi:hypothetical protein